ncbi:MAG: hypothetical protein HYZ71_11510 [Deltaproteobacteria bacterium]|nr:hypothetical protein [Deltaproteobacteria bacterium]
MGDLARVTALVTGLVWGLAGLADIPNHCTANRECLIEVPGTQCADGTPAFVTFTHRAHATNLMVYMKGGGACWNGKSCGNGMARPLSRVVRAVEWNDGQGIHDVASPGNPFREYDIMSIPYCTGDAFIGDRTNSYTDAKKAMTIHHTGYNNVQLSLKMAQELVPQPKKAVLMGCSAGGIGAFFHLRNFRKAFPDSEKFVVSDAGLPFKPPHIRSSAYAELMEAWGADKHMSEGFSGRDINNFGDVVRANTTEFPDTRFGLISSYQDNVMTFFGITVGSPVGLRIVHDNIIDIADNAIGRKSANAAVFFTETATHCHTGKDITNIKSMGGTLSNWLTDLVADRPMYNARPDLHHAVRAADLLYPADDSPLDDDL